MIMLILQLVRKGLNKDIDQLSGISKVRGSASNQRIPTKLLNLTNKKCCDANVTKSNISKYSKQN